ncbi:MAG: cyclic nucleotide-binding protein [Alphaproteobacteria bacterium]|nr:MAG: cyclic nucleotide-binding protein [Alphaproteobacteria bacterium]
MQKMDKSQKTFREGDIIMRQGELGESAYIIEEGFVEISLEKPDGERLVVATRGTGAIIGEMSLIDSAPRTATVTAKNDCVLLEITKDDFSRRLDASDPVLRMTMQVILTRYRDTLVRSDIRQDMVSFPLAEDLEREYLQESDTIDKIRISNEFLESLSNDEICLHYQPLVNLQDGTVYGFEALMRWFHPERGFIPPGIFIPIIEDSGLIIEASKWAFREACNALKRIQEQTGYHNELNMSVNFSSTDFSSDGFLDNIYNTISETDVQAKNIHLEITERLLINQPAQAKETLNICREAGMGISIDDFGTGYSSLSYLHAFPINTLKIDQSFIRDMHINESSKALVKSIITLGENLDMSIVAEGVEQIEEGKLLKEMGCNYAQGYYFAKPMSEKDVIECVSNWNNDMI